MPVHTEHSPVRLISRREFRQRLGGISRSTEFRLRRDDPSFPRVVPLTAGLTAISEADAEKYIRRRIAEAGDDGAPTRGAIAP